MTPETQRLQTRMCGPSLTRLGVGPAEKIDTYHAQPPWLAEKVTCVKIKLRIEARNIKEQGFRFLNPEPSKTKRH